MTDLDRIHGEINALPTAAKLELAAALWRGGKREVARTIVDRALLEIDAVIVGRPDLIPGR